MFRFPARTLHAAAFTISALLATAIAVPAAAQVTVSIGFDNFHNRLSPYGTWSNHPRWGEVWRPRAARDFRPYYNGRWEDTQEYGWLWVSDDSWGDIPYHYGRWVSDPREGWLWVPGYVWGPSWVVWREGGGNIGWFPMPPGDDYYGDGAYRDNFDNQYGYRDWYGPNFGNEQFRSLWIFVGEDHFRDRNFRNYAVPQRDYGRFFSQTRNTTNYVTVNNYVVNRSIDNNRFQRSGTQRFQPVPASSVMIGRNAPVTQVDIGRQVEQRERQRRPIPVTINSVGLRDRSNSNSNGQQNLGEAPPGSAARGGDRGLNSNNQRPTNPQTGRGVAAGPTAPTVETSRQSRGQANINPAGQRGGANPNANARQPYTNETPQRSEIREGNRRSNANGPAQANLRNGVRPPVVNTPSPNSNVPREDTAERRNRGPGATLSNPSVNRNTPPTAQSARGTQSSQTRGEPEQNGSGKVTVQDAPTPPRVQGNVPVAGRPADRRGNARDNEVRGNRQGDTKDNGSKSDGNERGRN